MYLDKKVLLLICGVALAGCATSTPYGHGDVVVGKVAIFRHKTPNMKKLDCTECHDKLFTDVKHHDEIGMERVKAGESCGFCHNGMRAFSVTGDCKKCHRKQA